jgi:hypothetical protein
MPHRYDHYDSIDDSMQEDLCPLCHGASQDSYLQGAGALRQRLERLEHLTHDVLLPAHQTLSPIARRVVMAREPEAPQPEQTLWQGRPALLAAVPGLVWAGAWTGLWSLASWQYQAIVAHVVQWHPLVRHGLRQMGAVKLAWWYSQGAAWLTTHAALRCGHAGPTPGVGPGLRCHLRLPLPARRAHVVLPDDAPSEHAAGPAVGRGGPGTA